MEAAGSTDPNTDNKTISVLAKEEAENWLTQMFDLTENIFPAALRQSNWCEESLTEAFRKAKFVEQIIVLLPKNLYHLQMKEFVLQGKKIHDSCDAFEKAGEMMYLRLTQNLELSSDLHSQINEIYLNLFGLNRLTDVLQKANLFLVEYKALSHLLMKESSRDTCTELEVMFFHKEFHDLDPHNIKSKVRSLLKSNQKYFKVFLGLAGLHNCDFRDSIAQVFASCFKDTTAWNPSLAYSVFFGVSTQDLVDACRYGHMFQNLVLEYLNECVAKIASRRIKIGPAGPLPNYPSYYWDLKDSQLTMERLQRFFKLLFEYTKPYDIYLTLSSMPTYSTEFWREAFKPSPPPIEVEEEEEAEQDEPEN